MRIFFVFYLIVKCWYTWNPDIQEVGKLLWKKSNNIHHRKRPINPVNQKYMSFRSDTIYQNRQRKIWDHRNSRTQHPCKCKENDWPARNHMVADFVGWNKSVNRKIRYQRLSFNLSYRPTRCYHCERFERKRIGRKNFKSDWEIKRPAYNWRFGASGGVAPRKVQWEIERLCPAWTVSYPPPAPSRSDVIGNVGRQCNLTKRLKE